MQLNIARQMSIPMLLQKRGIEMLNSLVTDEDFPLYPEKARGNYVVFHFSNLLKRKDDGSVQQVIRMSSDEAIKQIRMKGYEPATPQELALWNGWYGNTVLALGESIRIGESEFVMCLLSSAQNKYCTWYPRHIKWNVFSTYFLAVQE